MSLKYSHLVKFNDVDEHRILFASAMFPKAETGSLSELQIYRPDLYNLPPLTQYTGFSEFSFILANL